jgi:SAM-dependent methyltransferase
MGLKRDTVRVVARLLRGRAPAGRVLTFGVQKVDGRHAEVARWLEAEGYPYRRLAPDEVELDRFGGGERIHQDTFFRMLGYSEVESLDVSDAEGPTHRLDLNQPVPEALRERYDLVCDSGTLEHCFDPAEALCNAARLARRGGLVLHAAPVSGWLRHGFYQPTPELFFHFYAENGFDDLEARVAVEGRCLDPAEYLPRRDFLGRKALLVFVARKRVSAPLRFPIQGQPLSEESRAALARLGRGAGVARDPGRRALLHPPFWVRDLGAVAKQYLRLARRARRL